MKSIDPNPATEGVVQMLGSICETQGDVFYIESRAPYRMKSSHVHGHIELNYLLDCSATYWMNGRTEHIPENRLAIFWANTPHQMVELHGIGRLYNIYIPLPFFWVGLCLPHSERRFWPVKLFWQSPITTTTSSACSVGWKTIKPLILN